MNAVIFARYALILLILAPTLLYAITPLKLHLRYDARKTMLLSAASLAAIIAGFALLGTLTKMPMKYVVALSIFPLLGLLLALTQGNILRRIFCFFNSTMICGNSIVYGMILAAPLESDGSYALMKSMSIHACLAVSVVLGIAYYRTLSVRIPLLINSEALNMDYKKALPIVLLITVLFFWVIPNQPGVVMTGRVRVTILAFLLLAPGAFVLLYYSMWKVAVNLTENTRLRETNELMAMEQKRYDELRSYTTETRNLRHDFRQHLLVMEDYAEKGEIEKLRDYIGQFTETFKEYRSEFAANRALDAVASHYDAIASSQGTHIKWLIELPAELPIKESDLITIFGNLVENALKAVRDLPEDKRVVHAHAKMLTDAMIGISVKNPYEGTIKLNKEGLPAASKAGHGIGLSSVRAAVSRYNGTLDITTDDQIFTAGVLLYVN